MKLSVVILTLAFVGISVASPAKSSHGKGARSMLKEANMKALHKLLSNQKQPTPRYELPEPIFTCDTSTGEEPTSVHALTPGDIDIIAAVGDSVTTGYGIDAEDISEVQRPYRGKVFSNGGDAQLEGEDRVVTLANILKKFNPNIRGVAHGIAHKDDPEAGLNKATSDAESRDMLAQVQEVIAEIENNEDYDYENDWKMLVMYVGGYDLCYACEDQPEPGTEYQYRDNLREAIEWLKDVKEVPKMYVVLVPVTDISLAPQYVNSDMCALVQALTCPCLVDEDFFPTLRDLQLEYCRLAREDARGGRWDTRDDFTVGYQPFTQDILPAEDEEGLVQDMMSVDCFHPSTIGHQAYTLMMWHNMLSPMGNKHHFGNVIEDMDEIINMKCPTEEAPYIYTNLNSGERKTKD
ncbi:hypothetical protein CAPTEDRAFT_221103 [Capitella teleta]|uniref:Phospholipase B1, membrane-associated n=1 Tax=Capitella teleta TaxID=283909 RepID=R7VJ35_CAPTE|nr:hypothetical protein CAPTEDRAFT_221103 [Capitella teleta]|eukprot:ELU16326.1 hypothetical protein CAPTEDRAFT_221103 [Capitella teleta]